ncbi:hypothetical protein KI387_008080, partial [Taxus chinensis]
MGNGILFPILPDEIGWECLLRVEFNSHFHLRCVCRSWKSAVNSHQFYQDRQRSKVSEQCVCLIQNIGGNGHGEYDYRVSVYNPTQNTWKRLPPHAQIIPKGKRNFDRSSLSLVEAKTGFDGGLACRGASFPVCPNNFTSAADCAGGLINVAGGGCIFGEPVRIALVYKVEENKWEELPYMVTAMSSCLSAFFDGRFYVKDLYGSTIQVFDLHTRTWQIDSHTVRWKTRENRWNAHAGPVVNYDYSQNMWKMIGLVPGVKWATVFGHNIFVGGWKRTFSPVLHT